MIIDNHTHITNSEILKSYRKKGGDKIDKIITIPWCNKDDQSTPRIPDLEELLQFVKTEKDVYALGSIDMDKDITTQLTRHEELLKSGDIVGIKLYPGYQHFYPSDKRVIPIVKLCEKYKKPLVFHTGDCYDSANVSLLKYSHPMKIDELARKHSKAKIIISHFGFPYFLETANLVATNKNVFVDFSALVVNFGDSKKTKLLQKETIRDLERAINFFPLISDKIMFGTDYAGETSPLCFVKPYFDITKKLFKGNLRKNVYHQLAEKLYF